MAVGNVHKLSQYSPLVVELLRCRGIVTQQAAQQFLHPDYARDVHDPYLLSGMSAAVDRILQAIKENERIAVYSDYDMDGIPGAVVLHDFFSCIGYENTTHYIPNRNTEGFGLNAQAVQTLADDNVNLVITIDCGIRAVAQVQQARQAGMDVIITDHHVPGDTLPPANIVLNPLQEHDIYPNKHLCGAGVIFKLVQALSRHPRFAGVVPQKWEKWVLDMVACATIADMVPLVGENRALAHFGLIVARKTMRPGIRALCTTTRVKQPYITEDDVVFSFAPRINAASRMGKAEHAFRLLTAKMYGEAKEQARQLEQLNRKRKTQTAVMTKQIKKTVQAYDALPDVLLVGDTGWEPGMLGLAAQRAVELYQRPVCVWGRGGSKDIKGSCRSTGSVDVVELLTQAKDVLHEYGGHTQSGGFAVTPERLHELRDIFMAYEVDDPAVGETSITIDRSLPLHEVTWTTYHQLSQLGPFGMENPKPVFSFEDVPIESVRRFGADGIHAALMLARESREPIETVHFFAGDTYDEVYQEGTRISFAAHLDQSVFRKDPELRLRIVAIL